ncbi:MAG: glycine/sarcosine/betaine reductase selenoprotein B family protein [Acidimicrobiales bacterium]
MSVDDAMLAYLQTVAVPDMGPTPFLTPRPLADAQVAIVTTAGLQVSDQEGFDWFDSSFRVLPGDRRDLVMSHHSQNFDRAGAIADLNVVYPVDRLAELVTVGLIGSVAPTHISFMGAQRELTTLIHDSGRTAAAHLREQGTDIAILTPV